MSDPQTWEILALKYGVHTGRKRVDNLLFADDHAREEPIDYYVWALRCSNRTILIDTGFNRAEAAKRNRTLTHEPREVLKLIGVDADTIDTVIVSHLHYDHAGTLDHFPAARFHLQEAEMAFATGPCMCEGIFRQAFEVEHVCQMVRNVYSGRVIFHDGDAEVAPGVTVHKVPGHSKGVQCVRVATESGHVVLAVDAIHMYDNYELRKPFPIVIDVEATLKSYDRITSLATSPAHIVPGHDPRVLKRYPALDTRSEGVVHRLDLPRRD